MNNNNRIRSAIESSSKSGRIIIVDIDCPADQLEDLLLLTIACNWNMRHREDDKSDVWGWTDNTPENYVEFRLIVQCQPKQVEA